MTDHKITREVGTQSREEISIDRLGNTTTDIYIQAITDTGEWNCVCGSGPFDTKDEAKGHLKESVQ